MASEGRARKARAGLEGLDRGVGRPGEIKRVAFERRPIEAA